MTVARTRLANMVAASSRPVLSDEDLDALLAAARTVDSQGYLVTDAGYTPTWDLNRAAAEGWRWKAGRVAGDFDFSADDASYSKGAVMQKCLDMEALYEARSVGFVVQALAPGTIYDSPRLVL